MKSLNTLVVEVDLARKSFIRSASNLTSSQASFKSFPEEWSIIDNVEHMVWAEMGGINGIWKTYQAIKAGKPIWTGDAIHHGLPIETIIEKTWKEKEIVPEVAKPRWGGPVQYWIIALQNCQPLLEELGKVLVHEDLEQIIYPHSISGPLNVIQRMEFLRFHLNRHQNQIERIKSDSNFPK
jgi:hypothetical protein